ncbi:MAG: hypothetical protein AAF567_11305 [Actinomycetota bacterium]
MVLFATASFFWLVTTVGQAASNADAQDDTVEQSDQGEAPGTGEDGTSGDESAGSGGSGEGSQTGGEGASGDGDSDDSGESGDSAGGDDDGSASDGGNTDGDAGGENTGDGNTGDEDSSEDEGTGDDDAGDEGSDDAGTNTSGTDSDGGQLTCGPDTPAAEVAANEYCTVVDLAPTETLDNCSMNLADLADDPETAALTVPFGFDSTFGVGDDALDHTTCYDVRVELFVDCSANAGVSARVSGTILEPPKHADGTYVNFGAIARVTPGGDLATPLTGTPDATGRILTFSGAVDPVASLPATFEIEAYGRILGTIEAAGSYACEPAKTDSGDEGDGELPTTSAPEAISASQAELLADTSPCFGNDDCILQLDWDCAGNVFVNQTIATALQPTLSITFTPDANQPGLVEFTSVVTSTGQAGGWNVNQAWSPASAPPLDPGRWTATATWMFAGLPDDQAPQVRFRTDCEAIFGFTDPFDNFFCPGINVEHNVFTGGQFPFPDDIINSIFAEFTTLFVPPGATPVGPTTVQLTDDYYSSSSASFSLYDDMYGGADVTVPGGDGTGWFSVDMFNNVIRRGGLQPSSSELVIDSNGFAVVDSANTDGRIYWHEALTDFGCVRPEVDCTNGQTQFTTVVEGRAPEATILAGPSNVDPFVDGQPAPALNRFPGDGVTATYWVKVQEGPADNPTYSNRTQFLTGVEGDFTPSQSARVNRICTLDVDVFCSNGFNRVSTSTELDGNLPDDLTITVSDGDDTQELEPYETSDELTGADNGNVPMFTVTSSDPHLFLRAGGVVGNEITVPARDCIINVSSACANGISTVTILRDDSSTAGVYVQPGDTVDDGPDFDDFFPFDDPDMNELSPTDGMFEIISIVGGNSETFPLTPNDDDEPALLALHVVMEGTPPSAISVDGDDPETFVDFELPRCIAPATIECVTVANLGLFGIATIFIDIGDTPATDSTVVNSGSGDTDNQIMQVDEETWAVGNEDPGLDFSYLLTANNGVVVVADDPLDSEVPNLIGGEDCHLHLDVFCDQGDAAFQATGFSDDGADGIFQLDWTNDGNDGTHFYTDGPVATDRLYGDTATFEIDMAEEDDDYPFSINDTMTGPVLNVEDVPMCYFEVQAECDNGQVLVDAMGAAETPANAAMVTLAEGETGTITDNGDGTFTISENTAVVVAPRDDPEVYVIPTSTESAPEPTVEIPGRSCTIFVEWDFECEALTPKAVLREVTGPEHPDMYDTFFYDYDVQPQMAEVDREANVRGEDVFTDITVIEDYYDFSSSILSAAVATAEFTPEELGFVVVFQPESATSPACEVSATGTCANGVITGQLSASPEVNIARVEVDGVIVGLSEDNTATVDGNAPTTVVEFFLTDRIETPERFTFSPCTIDISVNFRCVDDMTTQAIVVQSGGTGTIAELLVNASADDPFLIELGSGPIAIQVASANTLQENITIPGAEAPAEGTCTDAFRSDTRVLWFTECEAGNPGFALVALMADGLLLDTPSANGEMIAIDLMGNPIYRLPENTGVRIVANGGSRTVFIIQIGLDGNPPDPIGRTPDCPAPPERSEIEQPPPEVIIDDPEPELVDEPDPEPQDEPEPDPEPEPEADPEPGPEPEEEEPEPEEEEPQPEVQPEPEEEEEEDEVLPEVAAPIEVYGAANKNLGTTVLLPSECDLDQGADMIDLPNAISLTETGRIVDDGGVTQLEFTVTTTQVEPGEVNATISCGTTVVNVSLLVHSPTGGESGQRTIAVTVTMLSALGLAVGGSSRLIASRMSGV